MTRPRTGFPFLDAGLERPGSVLAFAHRGGAFHPEIEGLENTLTAFRHAVDLGYHYLETDVHATRDGVLLAFHDLALDRLTGQAGSLAELSADEAQDILVGGREQIPTLEAVLEEFPAARFNIDLKSDQAALPLARLLARMRAEDRVCVGAFSPRRMSRFRALVGPLVATAATPVEVGAFRYSPTVPLASGLAGSGFAALQVPRRRGRLQIVTRSLVERAHALGRHVHVWVVDESAEMHELLDLGVDGVMTDRTDVLRGVLLERGQWTEAGA